MNINLLEPCDNTHRSQLQYCCYNSKKLFCQNCWLSQGHFTTCNSSRCGHFQKIAHKIIGTTLQMKTMQFLADMCPNFECYDRFHKKFQAFTHMITRQIKNDIDKKLPLFIWSTICQMLVSKNPQFNGMVYEDMLSFDMLRIIKNTEDAKLKHLEEVIKSYQKINHQFQGLQNRLKQKNFTGILNNSIQDIISFFSRQGNGLISKINVSIKKHVELQFARLLKQFDSSIQFDGVKFSNRRNFQNIQFYNMSSLYSSLNKERVMGNSYHGTVLNIEKLQETPQLLLQVSKSMLKQKIFNIHSSINELKSSYPYKYGYVICTTLQPDPEYEINVLNLQKLNIKMYEKKSQHSFLNSVNLIIMGPQLITVEFRNHPKKMAEITIFGAVQGRKKHYNDLIENHLGISRQKAQKIIKQYPFSEKLKPVELVYAEFQLAYEHLFTKKQSRADFEGEKYALGRGIKLFQEIVAKWKTNATIQFQIEKSQAQYLRLFI